MRKRLRPVLRARRIHHWPMGSSAGTARLHEPPEWTLAAPDDRRPPTVRGVTHLRLISPAPAPRPTAPVETEEAHPAPDNRRADAEAALGLVLVLLVCLAIARADDLRRLTDDAAVAIEQRITALDEVRIGLRMAYAELRWRAGERP
jgi:hypothetical protein